jgi:flagellar basal-body rod protein FlgF
MADIKAQISASQNVLMQDFDIIAHNLANASTPGFKRRTSAFATALQAQREKQGTAAQNALMEKASDFTQGGMTQTARPLDFAIDGKGFFGIETPDGPRYTRNGTFHTNENGQLVDSQGRMVAGQNGPIVIPPTVDATALHVSGEGGISANGLQLGQLQITDFGEDQGKLIPIGSSIFMAPPEVTGSTAENVVVKQGYQESSNVKIVHELVRMMTVSRLYDANMRFVTSKKDATRSIMNVAMG